VPAPRPLSAATPVSSKTAAEAVRSSAPPLSPSAVGQPHCPTDCSPACGSPQAPTRPAAPALERRFFRGAKREQAGTSLGRSGAARSGGARDRLNPTGPLRQEPCTALGACRRVADARAVAAPPLEHTAATRSRNAPAAIPRVDFRPCDPPRWDRHRRISAPGGCRPDDPLVDAGADGFERRARSRCAEAGGPAGGAATARAATSSTSCPRPIRALCPCNAGSGLSARPSRFAPRKNGPSAMALRSRRRLG
jgi:hypothetical protein